MPPVRKRHQRKDQAVIRNDTSFRYNVKVIGINKRFPDYAACRYPDVYYHHLSTVVLGGESSELQLLDHDPKGIFIEEVIHRQLTNRKKLVYFHCGYCFLGFSTKRAAKTHSFGQAGRSPDCKKKDSVTKFPFACNGVGECRVCIPRRAPAEILIQMQQQVHEAMNGRKTNDDNDEDEERNLVIDEDRNSDEDQERLQDPEEREDVNESEEGEEKGMQHSADLMSEEEEDVVDSGEEDGQSAGNIDQEDGDERN